MTFNRPDRLVTTYKTADPAISSVDHDVVASGITAASAVVLLDGPIETAALPGRGANNTPETANANKFAMNRVIRVDGTIFRTHNGRVYSFVNGTGLIGQSPNSDPTTGSWLLEATFDGYLANSSNQIGLYHLTDFTQNNKAYLVTAYQSGTTSTWMPLRYDIAEQTWESGLFTTLDAIPTNSTPLVEVEVDNKVYFVTTTDDLFALQPDLTFIRINLPSSTAAPYDLCGFKNKTYLLASDSRGSTYIWEVTGNGVVEVAEVDGDAVTSIDGNSILFTDRSTVIDGDPKLYAIWASGIASEWKLAEFRDIGSGLQFTRRLDSLLFTDDANGGITARRTAHLNATSLIEGSGVERDAFEIHFRPSTKDFVNWNSFVWAGADTSPTGLGFVDAQSRGGTGDLDTGIGGGFDVLPANHWATPHDKGGGGGRWYPGFNINRPTIDITPLSGVMIPESGLFRISWKLKTSLFHHNGEVVRVKFMYDTQGFAPVNKCTLTNPSHGSINGLGENVVVANSGDVYTVDWNVLGDGVQNLTTPRLVGVVDVRSL